MCTIEFWTQISIGLKNEIPEKCTEKEEKRIRSSTSRRRNEMKTRRNSLLSV